MRVLLDTNVVLDVLLQRSPWLNDADTIWQSAQVGRIEACITASALTDMFYITRRLKDEGTARQVVRRCLDVLTILPVTKALLEAAYLLPTSDFEDALQEACAGANGLDAIITRDAVGFGNSAIAVMAPAQLVQHPQASGQNP